MALDKRIAVVAKKSEESEKIALQIAEKLGAGADPETAKRLKIKPIKNPEIVFVIGGDGTVLHSEYVFPAVPKICFSQGRVSFLSGVETRNLDWILKRLEEGKYFTEERTKLSSNILPDALNEVAILRYEPNKMMEAQITIDRAESESVRGDGILVSTPTGSTAYALSCGGPIIVPSADLIALVPVAPFKLRSRPIIISGESRVTIIPKTAVVASVDGQKQVSISAGRKIEIRKSKTKARFIRFQPQNFFEKLKLL